MFAHDFFLRLPPTTTLLVISSILSTAHGHAVPRQTKTVPYTELDVLPWPLPTPMANDLIPRQLNTICGYIGGDPDLPATCSAGSHCAVDVEHGAIGCCPDGGACTAGVYTGCVDGNSSPQTEVNPYVHTCGGGNVCYQNQFEGGFFQYGCGSSSEVAATVVATASGRDAIDLSSITVEMTASATLLSEPTTLGTGTRTGTRTETTSGETDSSTTESSSTTASDESSTSSEATATATNEEEDPDAPESDDDGGVNVGAIVGGSIGGVAFVALLVTLALYLLRRRRGNTRQGPQNQGKQFIDPADDNNGGAFAPLPSVREVNDSQLPRGVPAAYGGAGDYMARDSDDYNEPYTSAAPYTSSSVAYSDHTTAYGGGVPMEHDQQPLTREADDFSNGANNYHGGLGAIQEERELQEERAAQDDRESPIIPAIPGFSESQASYMPRRNGGGALWQQNRGPQTRNPMWL